jgi:hypothetical protein
MRMFELHREVDHNGHSGIGVVASGVEFSDGMVVMRWAGVWPTSVVFHEKGIASVEHLHGHGGDTKVVFLDAKPTEQIELERAQRRE